MYSRTVWEHSQNPRNRGDIENPDATGQSRYHRCGDVMRLTFRLVDDRVEEVRFRAHGCGPAVAAASMATTMLQGLPVDQARQLNAFELDKALGGLPISKRHAILMVLECLAEALGSRTSQMDQ